MNYIKNYIIDCASHFSLLFPCCPCFEEESDFPTTQIETTNHSRIQECYQRNVNEILLARGYGTFIQRKGNLIFCPEEIRAKISPTDQEEGMQLVKQVLRQAWGKVVEAQYAIGVEKKGPMLLEEAIHRVDVLQDKLRQTIPSELAHKILADEKWTKVLANNYKASSDELIEKIKVTAPSADQPKIDKIYQKLIARDKVIQQYRETKKGEYQFIPLTKETGGVNFSGTQLVKKGNETCVVSKRGTEDVGWENSDLAWLNEMIGASFDQLCGHRFGSATSTLTMGEGNELNTIHSFKKTEDDRWHEAFDKHADLRSSHQFVLFNILLKTQDAHKGNILCRRERGKYVPIPIDFGRLLSPAPHRILESMLRFTPFVKWATLDQKFDEETKEFVKNLDPKQMIHTLKQLFIDHPSLKPAQKDILERKLVHLYANILMVKEALKEDLTPRQLIALSTFKLTHADLKQMETISKNEERTGRRGDLMRKYMMKFCYCAFLTAWNTARVNGVFDEEKYIRKIRQSILRMKGVNVMERYFYPAAIKKFDDLYL